MRGTRSLPLALLSPLLLATAGADDRWYDDEQVRAGGRIYQEHCLACHRQDGAGHPTWQQRGADGAYPPPPLNGTAHTWHHDLATLSRTIREGGAKLGGVMPPFRDQLDDTDIIAVIAYLQSLWPEQAYATWAKAYPRDAAR